MSNVVQGSAKEIAIKTLMETISKIQSGETIGVTLVTTSNKFIVAMDRLLLPTEQGDCLDWQHGQNSPPSQAQLIPE